MKRGRSVCTTLLLASCPVVLAALMVRYPEVAVSASLQGLEIWWHNVFPALFPFFVLSELMISFGVVQFAATLFEPVMRPLFRLPGAGGFVLVMGMISGFPAGARMTARLYKEQQLTKLEAERLSAFTNFSNPLFLFSVTAVQFFHEATLGIIFALSHYIGNVAVGFVLRGTGRTLTCKEERDDRKRRPLLLLAFKAMHRERLDHTEPFGKLLGDAVIASVSALLAVGGFIALFSMIYRILIEAGTLNAARSILCGAFAWLGFSPKLGSALLPGIFELTIGVHQVGAVHAPMIERVVLASALLGFCGFSIQAQAVSILAQAGLKVRLFLIGRLMQAAFSGCAAFVLYRLFMHAGTLQISPTLASLEPLSGEAFTGLPYGSWITASALMLFILLLLRRKN
ncbi:MAG: sporulation integral membrane protein YlbJ [Sporolactobacillus sp.]